MPIVPDQSSNQAGPISRLARSLGNSRSLERAGGLGGGRGTTPYQNGFGFRSGENLALQVRQRGNERVRNMVREHRPHALRHMSPTTCCQPSHQHGPALGPQRPNNRQPWTIAPGSGMPPMSPASLLPTGLPSGLTTPQYIGAELVHPPPGLPPGPSYWAYNDPPLQKNGFHGRGGYFSDEEDADDDDDEFSGIFDFGGDNVPHRRRGLRGWNRWSPYQAAPYDNLNSPDEIPIMPASPPGSYVRVRPGQRGY